MPNMSPPRIFTRTENAMPGRSVFDLSHRVVMTGDMGPLYPSLILDCVPGDMFSLSNQIVIRFFPLIAPLLHEVNVFVHYFFVPYRILWDDWEDFITGGIDGMDSSVPPVFPAGEISPDGLGDYFGFPVNVNIPVGSEPAAWPWLAYNRIYNEYYRDETLDTPAGSLDDTIRHRRWEKDYFTSALPFQQRGTAPALPISGTLTAVFEGVDGDDGNLFPLYYRNFDSQNRILAQRTGTPSPVNQVGPNMATTETGNLGAKPSGISSSELSTNNDIDASGLTTFNVADLRLAIQVQRWMERNARAGARYTESLKAHFGVAPRDERLQRPEYIGGTRSPVIFSEVLQTSATDSQPTPQGNLAGHGISADHQFGGKYHCHEHGIIVGMLSVMPRSGYSSQGINRQWARRTRYDYYFPEFAHLSEMGILNNEIFTQPANVTNQGIFGFQGVFDELRFNPSRAVGLMRSTFAYWHMMRIFDSLPTLSSSFVNSADVRKDVFAAPSQPGLVISVGNVVKAVRPMPAMPIPGLMDHG